MPSSRLTQPESSELVTDVTSKLHTAMMLCAINVSSIVSALKVAAFDELLARRFAASAHVLAANTALCHNTRLRVLTEPNRYVHAHGV